MRPTQRTLKQKQERNFTDPESRIMLMGLPNPLNKVTMPRLPLPVTGKRPSVPMLPKTLSTINRSFPWLSNIEENLGEMPDRGRADSGDLNTGNVEYAERNFMEPFICLIGPPIPKILRLLHWDESLTILAWWTVCPRS